MTFVGLILHNVGARRLRAVLTGAAVAIGVMAVVGLGVLTTSLKQTATQILKVGDADFTVAQKHTDDILNSTLSDDDVAALAKVPGVGNVIGALVQLEKYDDANPVVIEVGLVPSAQQPFGVDILEGRSYAANSSDEVMVGYSLAQTLKKKVGDQIVFDGRTYQVVGVYRTNNSFGNSTVMFPLSTLQGLNRLAGQVTLGFVKVAPGANVDTVAKTIDEALPQLTTIRNEADYGRADRNLTLINAANVGGSILAALIAITGVLNTALLSFFERVREFGVLRSVGWSRRRVLSLVLGETLLVSVAGAAVGLVLGWGAVNVLQNLSSLKGVFDPVYEAWIFGRALIFAFVVAILGALYPAMRAAFLAPAEALRRE